jgi:hypothetical protein
MKIRDSPYKKMRKQPNINNICKYKVQRNKEGGYVFFLKKYSDSLCCLKKYSDCGGGKTIM